MRRYLISCSITLFIYVLLFATYIYALDIKPHEIKKNKNIKKVMMIRVRLQSTDQKIVKSVPRNKMIKNKKVIKSKNLKKNISKEKIKKVYKKTKEKVKIKKNDRKTFIQKVRNITKELKSIPKKKSLKKVEEEKKVEVKSMIKESYKNRYYLEIKKRIEENKSYPRRAYKRKIQGKIKVKFIIASDGNLISFEILSGKKVFKNSVLKAIEMSFPYMPPKDTFYENISLVLDVNYKLN